MEKVAGEVAIVVAGGRGFVASCYPGGGGGRGLCGGGGGCVVDGAFSYAIIVHLPRGDLWMSGVKPEKKALRMEM